MRKTLDKSCDFRLLTDVHLDGPWNDGNAVAGIANKAFFSGIMETAAESFIRGICSRLAGFFGHCLVASRTNEPDERLS